MGRLPYEELPAEGAAAEDMPIDAQWLGWWLGGGKQDAPMIAAAESDAPALRSKIQAIVDDLNRTKPELADPVQLTVDAVAANDSGDVISRHKSQAV
jgi:hypothetical protein